VKYELHPGERVMHTRAKQPMCVRDEAHQLDARVWHTLLHILGVSCRGYDLRSV
jgi:hypothetical protein